MSGLRSRSRQLKLGAAGLVAALLVAGIATGIVSGEPSAEPAAQNFLLAWAQGQYKEAAALTTGPPGPVTVALRTAYQQLGAAAYYLSMGQISQHSGVATAYFHASVDLGQDGAAWDYTGHFTLRKLSGSWKVVWSPAVINPGLRQGVRMAVVTRMPNRAPVLDAGGGSLIRPSAAWIAQVRPGDLKDPEATATAFADATGLDEEQVLSVIRAAPQSAPLTPADPAAVHLPEAAPQAGPGARADHAPGVPPPVQQRGQRRDRFGRHRDRPRAAGAGHRLPAGHHGRRVRAAGGLPAHAGRHAADHDRGRERGRAPGGRAEEVGRASPAPRCAPPSTAACRRPRTGRWPASPRPGPSSPCRRPAGTSSRWPTGTRTARRRSTR